MDNSTDNLRMFISALAQANATFLQICQLLKGTDVCLQNSHPSVLLVCLCSGHQMSALPGSALGPDWATGRCLQGGSQVTGATCFHSSIASEVCLQTARIQPSCIAHYGRAVATQMFFVFAVSEITTSTSAASCATSFLHKSVNAPFLVPMLQKALG